MPAELLQLHNIRTAHGIVIPTLRLNVNNIKAAFILFYNSIYATISASTDGPTGISARTSITYFDKQFHNDPFEKGW